MVCISQSHSPNSSHLSNPLGIHTLRLCLYFCFANKIIYAIVGSSVNKETVCSARDLGSIPGSGRSPEVGNGNPLQYSCWENPVDRETWRETVHVVARVGHELATKPPLCYFSRFHKYALIYPSNPPPGHIRRENYNSEGHTSRFIAALFTIARPQKQPECPSAEECIKKRIFYCKKN